MNMSGTIFAKMLDRQAKNARPEMSTPRVLLVSDLQRQHSIDQIAHAKKMFGGSYETLPVGVANQTARTILAEALAKGCKFIELGHDVGLDLASKLVAEATFMELHVIRALYTKSAWDMKRPQGDGGYAVTRVFSHYVQVHSIEVHTTALTAAGE